MRLIFLFILFIPFCILSQTFTNPGLEGQIISSQAPPGWQMIDYSDPICQATPISGFDSPDITGATGPSWDIIGFPYEGNTFISGLYLTSALTPPTIYVWHEGIEQNLTGLIPGNDYSITFHQSVVKQGDCRDESGAWSVYKDASLIANTAVSFSNLSPYDTTLIWDVRTVTFTASSTSHLIKFIPFDDDNDQEGSSTNLSGGLRMGIDAIEVTFQCAVTVNLGNDTTLCAGDTLTLYAGNPNANYSWNDGSTNQNLTVTNSGTYIVQVETGSCVDSDTINIIFNQLNADFSDSLEGCAPLTADFLGSSADNVSSWNWNFGDGNQGQNQSTSNTFINPGNYTISLTITDNIGCMFNIIKPNYINVYPTSQAGNDISTCEGNPVVLSGGGLVNSTFLWSNGSTNSTLEVSTSGNYWVEITTGNCTSRDTINVLYHQLSADFTESKTGCSPLYAEFHGSSSDTIINWQWDFGDGTFSTGPNTSNTYYNDGLYNITLTVTDNNGCTYTLIKTEYIEVYPNPDATILYSPSSGIYVDTEINFESFNTTGVNTSWYFGNGDYANGSSVNYSYSETGFYYVELFVENMNGCRDSSSVQIEVSSPSTLFIPNAFTPDNDEFNQTFTAVGTGITSFNMQIYNRWGEIVFESNNIEVGWDGNYRSELVQDGVYVWKIAYSIDNNPDKKILRGHLTLIR